MPHSHLTQWIEAAGARQIVATGLVLCVFALPAPAFAQSGLIGGFVGGMVNQGFQPQSSPQYYQPPPQQYYQPSTQQYYPQPSPQNNQPQLQQTNQQLNDQFTRDDEEAERLRQKRAAAIAAKKAKTQNISVDKAQNPPADQKGRDDATVASATPAQPGATAQRDAAVQPSTTLPAFPDQTAYADARTRLIALGYGPSPSGNQHCDPAKDDSCYPERESCFGSNVIQCNFSWTLGDKVIRVQTVNLPPTIAKVECVGNCQ
jgi:hypothetical protein